MENGGKRTTGVNECARREESSGTAGHVGKKGRQPEVEFDCHGRVVGLADAGLADAGLADAGLAGTPDYARQGWGPRSYA